MPQPQREVFVIRSVPATAITVGRANPRCVPDEVTKLSRAIVPDTATAPVTHSHEFPAAVPDLIEGPDFLSLRRHAMREKDLADMAPTGRWSPVKGPDLLSVLR